VVSGRDGPFAILKRVEWLASGDLEDSSIYFGVVSGD